jgi:hypothetical protein
MNQTVERLLNLNLIRKHFYFLLGLFYSVYLCSTGYPAHAREDAHLCSMLFYVRRHNLKLTQLRWNAAMAMAIFLALVGD